LEKEAERHMPTFTVSRDGKNIIANRELKPVSGDAEVRQTLTPYVFII